MIGMIGGSVIIVGSTGEGESPLGIGLEEIEGGEIGYGGDGDEYAQEGTISARDEHGGRGEKIEEYGRHQRTRLSRRRRDAVTHGPNLGRKELGTRQKGHTVCTALDEERTRQIHQHDHSLTLVIGPSKRTRVK